MSRTDDRIRSLVSRATLPVETDGVVERVGRRRALRRLVRRAGVVTMVVVALAASGATIYGLSRVIGPETRPTPGDTGAPAPSPTPSLGAVMPSWVCDLTDIKVDVDGNGVADRVVVDTVEPCDEEPGLYELRVERHFSDGTTSLLTQTLPECDTPWQCRVFSAPDIDGDGRAEIAVQTMAGASTLVFSLYRFDDEGGMQRLEVAPPGDAWHDEFGLAPGADDFVWFGSVTHLHWLSCAEDPENRLAVMTALRSEGDASRYRVHATILDVEGRLLVPVWSSDDTIEDRDLPSVSMGDADFCGSPIGAEYEG